MRWKSYEYPSAEPSRPQGRSFGSGSGVGYDGVNPTVNIVNKPFRGPYYLKYKLRPIILRVPFESYHVIRLLYYTYSIEYI